MRRKKKKEEDEKRKRRKTYEKYRRVCQQNCPDHNYYKLVKIKIS